MASKSINNEIFRQKKSVTENAKNTSKKEISKCAHCGKEYTKKNRNFYVSYSYIFKGNVENGNNYFPICSKCMNELYEHYYNLYKDERKAMYRMCELFDIYWDEVLLEACYKMETGTILSRYISRSNMVQYKGKTFDTYLQNIEKITKEKENPNIIKSVDEYVDLLTSDDMKEHEELDNVVQPKTIKFFGEGFEISDYRFLEDEYGDWTSRHECSTKTQEEIFKSIALNRLRKHKAIIMGASEKEIETIDNTFIKLLDSGNLQPKQNTSDALANDQTMGKLIQKWETERPISEPDEEFKDVDNIGKYIDVFFRGHITKMLNLKSAFSGLYEKFIKNYTVQINQYTDDEVDDTLFESIFGKDEF